MSRDGMIPIETNQQRMWTLSSDRKAVRLSLPPLRIRGMSEAIRVNMNFDAETIDAVIERLTILRGKTLPPMPAPNQRN